MNGWNSRLGLQRKPSWSKVWGGILLGLAAMLSNAQDKVAFAPNDTLDQIRDKIAQNGYQFTVKDTWVYRLSPEEKARMFPTRVAPPPDKRQIVVHTDAAGFSRNAKRAAESFDWRSYEGHSYVGSIRNQGSAGTCYAFGACAAAETTYNFAHALYDGSRVDFSESYVAWTLGSVWPYSDHFGGGDGADYDYYELYALTLTGPPEGATGIEGVCSEVNFPYTAVQPSQAVINASKVFPRVTFDSWGRVHPANVADTTEQIKAAIATYGVVDAAVLVTGAFDAYDHGVYQDTYTTTTETPYYYAESNHAIALVGWDDTPPEGGGGCWILRNSWGTSWGESGYMRIRYFSAGVNFAACYLVATPPDPTLAYTPEIFSEAAANDGSIGNGIVITLTDETFTADAVSGGHVTASNVPTGLTALFTRSSSTQIIFNLTGNAASHNNVDDIANLTVAFADEAFSGGVAMSVTNSTKADLQIDFDDPTLTYTPEVFSEAAANDGSIGNSMVITLSGETFVTDVVSGGYVTASNVPTGLTAVFTRDSSTQITFDLTGNAANHRNANDVANLTVTFTDDAFSGGDATVVPDSTKADLQIDFDDIYYAVHFTHNGSGNIQGVTTQSVVESGSTSAVNPVPAQGHHFTGWTGDIPGGQENDTPLTIANVQSDLDIVANFAINTYTLTFAAGPNGTVDGVAMVTQTVDYGASATGVIAIPNVDCLFTGWTGDYVGYDNPLIFASVTSDKAVTATFLDTTGMAHLTIGSAFTVTAGEADLLEFTKKPKLWAVYFDPVKDLLEQKPKKASSTVLDKVAPVAPTTQVRAEWKKKICLFDRKDLIGEQKTGTLVTTWLGEHAIIPLLVDQWINTKEPAKTVLETYRKDLFVAPEIASVVDNGDGTMTLSGTWFSTKKPKVWREYTNAKGAVKQQKLKVLAPVDAAIVNAKGKMSYMNADDGVSKIVVVIPKDLPPGDSSGVLVLDNGIGLAVTNDPSQP